MGMIKRNSIVTTFLLGAGYAIGVFSALFIYSRNTEGYGYATFLLSTANFLLPLASLGIVPVIYKYFPVYALQKKQSSAFFWSGSIKLIRNILFFIGLSLIFKRTIIRFLGWFNMNEELIFENYNLIVFLAVFLAIIHFLTGFINGWKRIVFPVFVNQFLYKIYLPLLILGTLLVAFNEKALGVLVVLFYAFNALALLAYLFWIDPSLMKFKLLEAENHEKKSIRNYANFSFLNTLGTTLAFSIDVVMIALLLDTDGVGKYGILFVLANIIDIPKKAVNQIAAPVISELISKENMGEVETVYRKASINLLVLGLLLFGGIWVSMNDILSLNNDISTLLAFKMVFFYLAVSKIVDMVTSVNTYIIIYSKFYRVNLVLILILGFLNIISNYLLINTYGIIGAAMATLIALSVFNLLKFFFIWWKFNMHIINWKSVVTLIVFIVLVFFLHRINLDFHPIINTGIKSAAFVMSFGLFVYYFKVALELNQTLEEWWTKFKHVF